MTAVFLGTGTALFAGLLHAGMARLPLFCAWWFILLNLVQSFESSLRVNVLRQLLRDGGSLDHAAFFARDNDRGLIELRWRLCAAMPGSGRVCWRCSRCRC